jgi:hypothetical protein
MLPALQRARDAGEPAGVLSVLAAGQGPRADPENLGLARGYTGKGAMDASATYMDLMVEVRSFRIPSLIFTDEEGWM